MRRTLAAVAALALGTAVTLAPVPTMAGSPAPAYLACTEEDGSGVQSFPCYWQADISGNGQGESYVLMAPVCSTYEVAAVDAAHRQGYELRLACDDLQSLIG